MSRDQREKQMLDAAVDVFSRCGYHDASMDEIAQAADVSKPMIYTYLGAKDELFTACVHRESGHLLECMVGGVAGDGSPEEQLHQVALAFFRFVTGSKASWLVLHRQAPAQPAFVGEMGLLRQRMINIVAGLLANALPDDGGCRNQSAPLAHALIGAAESLADWWLDNEDETPETLATHVMHVAWLGMAALVRGERWAP